MRIGFIGLGKLGLPVATTIAMYGHSVMGFDIDPNRMTKEPQEYMEAGPSGKGVFNEYLADAEMLSFGTIQEVADHADIIFVAVQTPHEPLYEGITALPQTRKDFDYTYLVQAMKMLSDVIRPGTLVVVISTCLPGTMRREILPLLPASVDFAYNPFFIAMGTVMRDFIDPEFVLIGADKQESIDKLARFYASMHEAPIRGMSIESAELTKVAYNTYISCKIAYANLLMEICEVFPEADVDDVTGALKTAYRRLISPAYLSGGMGDGGGCHPRDNIAMSWLAKKKGLSFDLFESIMMCREKQARWLADLVEKKAQETGLPIVIYGYAFKAGTNITVGSPALLVRDFCRNEVVQMYDPVIVTDRKPDYFPAVYLLGCNHPGIGNTEWPIGSVVIDPFRVTKDQEGVQFIRLGKSKGW